MGRICKLCSEPNLYPMNSLCKECFYKTHKDYKPLKAIKHKSTKNSNTPAKFSNETKKLILDRDIKCILCGKDGTDVHHVFFSNQAEYGFERNNINKGVLLCRICHGKCHSCKTGEGERQEVINYLLKLYAN